MPEDFAAMVHHGLDQAAVYRLRHPPEPAGGTTGLHHGRLAGSSLEYKDFREYQPGDDLRHIDWQAYARTDKLTLKLYHEEVIPHLDLVVDVSRSMALPVSAKQGTTVALAAFFAGAALHGGFSCNTWLAGATCRPLAGGGSPNTWTPFTFDQDRSPARALSGVGFRSRGVRIFISDLLWPEPPAAVTRELAHQAAAVLIVEVLATSDLNPPKAGRLRLLDAESGAVHELRMDETTRNGYLRDLQSHRDQWRRHALSMGVCLTAIEAETFYKHWRFEESVFHQYLSIR